jgi:hypothetical protein
MKKILLLLTLALILGGESYILAVTPTFTITVTPTYDETLGPILTQVAQETIDASSPTWTPTIVYTSTIVLTPTITPTITLTSTATPGFISLTSENLRTLRGTVTATDGTLQVNWWGISLWYPTQYTVDIQKTSISYDSQIKLLYKGINSITLIVKDSTGNPVNCSTNPVSFNLRIQKFIQP